MKYIQPEYKKKSFTCPSCGAITEQKWDYRTMYKDRTQRKFTFDYITCSNENENKELAVATCNVCGGYSFWINEKMILPNEINVPLPIEEMPEEIKKIYDEARNVYPISPKASAALLRLAIQHLCKLLGEKGKNINDDIKELVKKGLPVQIQQALDSIRVIGNNAVHPGTIDFDDDNNYAIQLFNMLNIIVNDRVIQPKKIEEIYKSLPQNVLSGIEERDK
ncbi:hypothetical protein UT300005_05530 [Clostridium sp. CTA-5]